MKRVNILKTAISVLIIYFVVESFINGFYFLKTFKNYKDNISILNQLKIENKDLKDKIEYAKSDEFIEKYARENLGLAKPDETIIYFDVKDNFDTDSQSNSENFIKNLLKLFKK